MQEQVRRSASGHIIPKEKQAYNDRLFNSGWRRYFHEARFRWLRRKMAELHLLDPSVIEIGCFDGKTADYFPGTFRRYVGYDADWEGGLTIGKLRWQHDARVSLHFCESPESFNPSNEQFDCSIAQETLEHLPTNELESYLSRLAVATRQYCFISVPNESGPPFIAKYLFKWLRRTIDEPYSWREWWYAATGRPARVQRVERGHKGFDHAQFLLELTRYFDVISIEGIPLSFLPLRCNFSIGIVARPKQCRD